MSTASSKNISNSTTTEPNFPSPNQFYHHPAAVHVALGFLIAVSAYLLAASGWYQRTHARKRCCSNLLFVLSSLVLLMESAWFEVEVAQTSTTSLFCMAYFVINTTSATLIRTLVYVVLWLRQKELYKSTMSNLKSKCIVVLSKATLAGIVTFGILQIACLVSTPQTGTPSGCVSRNSTRVIAILTPTVFTISSLFQFILLGLTLYPVVRHMCGKMARRNQKGLEAIVVRLSVCTLLCVVCDLAFLAVSLTKPKSAPYNFTPILFAFNSLINLIVSLCSFVDYSYRLWPFRKARPSDAQRSRSETENQKRSYSQNQSQTVIDYSKPSTIYHERQENTL